MKIAALVFLISMQAHALGSLCAARASGLDYVLHEQQQRDGDDYRTGEWKTQIEIRGLPRKLGVLHPGPFEDPNAFTLSSIQTALSEIYAFNHDARIRSALSDARDALPRYQTKSGGIDFWPKNAAAGPDGHLPVSNLTIGLIKGLTTVPADADDTALGYYALSQTQEIIGGSPRFDALDHDDLAQLFSKYTDSVRLAVPRFYQKQKLWTGAFLTWLKRGPVIPLVSSAFFPASAGPRIVLGVNIVDCVVNANVLRTLTHFHATDTKGYQGSCNYLNDMALHERYNSCGFYYPDTYWMHYATVRAYKEGATCLKPAVELNLKHLLRTQKPDGSWHNEVIEEDDTLATALAASALVRSGSQTNPKHVAALKQALEYLESHQKNGHWHDGIFFSAGDPARKTVLWRSDAFTTALVTELFFEAQSWFPTTCHS